ncbi:unnamed protein product [Phaedon cochleariae]|uniref:Reverse transcriptase domain-containing protein n=1 Tax=Phaedon cochleariae TaxID=80249 RepID=A0A9N9SAE2_PHACE|nr:unnamed protein product [Phaedon cochleariae]
MASFNSSSSSSDREDSRVLKKCWKKQKLAKLKKEWEKNETKIRNFIRRKCDGLRECISSNRARAFGPSTFRGATNPSNGKNSLNHIRLHQIETLKTSQAVERVGQELSMPGFKKVRHTTSTTTTNYQTPSSPSMALKQNFREPTSNYGSKYKPSHKTLDTRVKKRGEEKNWAKRPPHFKFEDHKVAQYIISRNEFLAKIDLKDAYFFIPKAKTHGKYLKFNFNNTLWKFKVLPFGLSVAPHVFTNIFRPVPKKLRSEGLKSVVYWCTVKDTCIEHVRY